MSITETTVFNQDDVLVTTARLVISGQTYAMSGITSVQFYEEEPSRKLPMSLCVIGGMATLMGLSVGFGGATFVGIVLAAAGIGIWMSQKQEFSVRLATASGEAKALRSSDKQQIKSVVEAINNAIIQRG